MKNILLLIDSLGSGGAQRQMVTLAELLQGQGYRVSFLVYYKFDFFKERLDALNISVHYILEQRPVHRIYKVRKHIRNGGYDAVISFLGTPDFLNCISAIGGKKWKVITSERSAKKRAFTSCKGKVYGWFRRFADTIVCNSHHAMGMWENYYPQYKNKLQVIYNPVLLPNITLEYIPKHNEKLHVVIAASYQYLKNPIGVVKALALMNEADQKRLMIDWYGDKDFQNEQTNAYVEASELIAEHGLRDVIRLNGPTKAIADKMQEADVVALFSELEGLPNAICEGMMLGKPIIMSRVSDYDTLVDATNGFLCDWDNVNSIKEALVQASLLSSDELLSMGKASKAKADKLFSNKTILEKWITTIEK